MSKKCQFIPDYAKASGDIWSKARTRRKDWLPERIEMRMLWRILGILLKDQERNEVIRRHWKRHVFRLLIKTFEKTVDQDLDHQVLRPRARLW